MALIIQNDDGNEPGANSYSTVAEFRDYWTARGVDYSSKSDAEIEAWLIPGREYLDNRFVWAGYKKNGRDQTTAFPREELYDCSGREPVLVEGVPREAKEAQNEYAHIFADQGTLQPNGSITGNIKRKKEKVDVIEEEIEYSPPGEAGSVVAYPNADNKIPACFTVNPSGSLVHM